MQLEESAKAAGKGKWGPAEESNQHVRDITWAVENPRHFVDSHHNKPVDGKSEGLLFCATASSKQHVRDMHGLCMEPRHFVDSHHNL